jgi:hypothetical protein
MHGCDKGKKRRGRWHRDFEEKSHSKKRERMRGGSRKERRTNVNPRK